MILIPIRTLDFGPTEVVAGGWKVLSELGHEVRFATRDARAPVATI